MASNAEALKYAATVFSGAASRHSQQRSKHGLYFNCLQGSHGGTEDDKEDTKPGMSECRAKYGRQPLCLHQMR